MPALIPVDTTLGSLFVGTVLSSIVYGVTLLQVYSYCNSHCSRDRWPLKSLVALLMLVHSVNLVFANHTTYRLAVTNFGDYSAFHIMPWSLLSIALSASVLEISVQHFYAYRIYLLSGRSPYLPAAISAISLTAFGIGIVLGVKGLKHINLSGDNFRDIYIATLSCDLLCDVLITCGMVYTLWKIRTPFRGTKSVLNLLAIYAINCGILNLVFTISGIILLVMYRDAFIFLVPSLIVIQLYFCAFMAILNSRDNLRATLDRHLEEIDLGTVPKLVISDTAVTCSVRVTTESSYNTAVSEIFPPVRVSSYASFSGSISLDREKYPVSPVPAILTGRDRE